ncbi:unnamed protein product [Protopolystoma xenopodis]|uniref:Uncharacterized protein n=1 Tax=Protopolystoma xenopodis TaxID=117903 RepID=A0A448XI77_9PLAT|nr:unnamed protein product [Protopolystoma xenopodis]
MFSGCGCTTLWEIIQKLGPLKLCVAAISLGQISSAARITGSHLVTNVLSPAFHPSSHTPYNRQAHTLTTPYTRHLHTDFYTDRPSCKLAADLDYELTDRVRLTPFHIPTFTLSLSLSVLLSSFFTCTSPTPTLSQLSLSNSVAMAFDPPRACVWS